MTLTSLLLMMAGLALATTLCTTPVLLMAFTIILAAYFATLLYALFSSWMALTLFLIYVGAMLVMFAYFVAMSPNQLLTPAPIAALILTPMIVVASPTPLTNPSCLNTLTPTQSPLMLLYNSPLPPIFLAIILLLILILVAKLATRSKGPLRPFNT